ncbi:MAG: DUF4115 domain-containing protein [Leptolyngbyaceae cyanobacterium bins.349]|nr:DUF4115 domain-containing protein [Leptolyngbyaceae cyanobacterium bins.349]
MKELSSVQVEQLKQIGDYLQQVRETQAVPLEKVAKDTFIPLRLLQALEIGDGARLPEPVYIKGFIRRYADVLGLDGQEVADAFEVESAPEVEAAAVVVAPPPDIPSPSVASSSSHQEEVRPSGFPVVSYVLSGIAAVGVLGAIAFGVTNFLVPKMQLSASSGGSTQATNNVNSNVAAPSVSGAPARPDVGNAPTVGTTPPSPPSSALAEPATEAPDAPVKVDISLTDRSWMEVVADGKVEFEGTLGKGEQRTWTAKNNLSIRAGNAGAVVASHNQGQAKPLGRLGDVVDVRFSRKN